MTVSKLSVDDALSFGWNGMKKHLGLLLGILTATFLLAMVPGLLGYLIAFFVQSDVIKILGGLLLGLVAAGLHDLIEMGMLNVQLKPRSAIFDFKFPVTILVISPTTSLISSIGRLGSSPRILFAAILERFSVMFR